LAQSASRRTRVVILRQDVVVTLPGFQTLAAPPVIRVPASAPARWGLLA
jgi:hypothetical protein